MNKINVKEAPKTETTKVETPKTETKKVETKKVPKVEKVKVLTLRERIDMVFAKPQKTIEEGCKIIFTELEKANQLINIRGGAITAEKLVKHFKNYMRDIKTARKGHWSTKQVVENETGISIVPKN
jgi:hypothetical protein